MPIKQCRVCFHDFFEPSLLQYKNIPKAVQFLPDRKSIESERGVDLEICQCAGCGLVQLNSVPVPYYKEVIRAGGFSDGMKDFRKQQFEHFMQKYFLKGKKVIEIGCGRGEYLSVIQQRGMNAYGLEYSLQSVKDCHKKNLKVFQGFVEKPDQKLYDAPFNAFFILNFLEHLQDPNSTLRGISYNLAENAVGIVEVPNFDMIIEEKLFSEFVSDHLFYFTRDTLISTLQINGFEVIECQNVWHDYMISATVKKRTRLDLTDFGQQQRRLKKQFADYLKNFGDKKVAIWGAGCQSLTLIALMNLADKINYVVDSATFKQGKYTPATHLPIVAPNTLNSDPVDAVIIIAAGYSDEVAGILRQQYDKKINVAILRGFGLEVVN